MRLNVLGPLELVIDHEPVKIGGPRECVVLAALALRPGRVASLDHLAGAVWGEAPPATARAQIHSSISRLRKLFASCDGGIETSPAGYRLCLAEGELDSELFAELVCKAKRLTAADKFAEAAAVLGEALELWRGQAYDGVQSDLVQQGATLLDDALLSAVEERVRLLLELGKHEAVIGELRALCAEHPLRERLYGFLMLALYRSGRQAEAVEVYRTAHSTLRAEAGIEPCTELRDLERAVLNRHAELDAPRAEAGISGEAPSGNPRQLPRSIADFVGREAQVSEIQRLLTGRCDGDSSRFAVPVIAISGLGGVGKSTLALRIAHELGERYPDGHLYADLHGDPRMENTHAQLARFLYALGFTKASIPEDPQERAKAFRSRLASKRHLLVLDNVTAEHQVLPLLPGSPCCAVIVTSRVRLFGLPGAHWIDLDTFDDDTSTELLGRIVGPQRLAAEPEQTADLVRYCGSLPLALRIAGTRLASRPQWKIEELTRRLADEARRLDEFSCRGLELRSSMALTYRSLPETAQRLFRLLSILEASDFPAWTAAAVLDCGLAEAEQALETLVDARMVECRQYQGRQIRYGFHDLVRVYAREQSHHVESDVERRDALQRVLGGWLALAQQVHRAHYGGDHAVLHGTAPRWDGVAAAAHELVGWQETEREAVVAAIRQAAAASMAELCWDLVLTAVRLFEVKGYLDEWLEVVQLAYRVCERAGNRTGCAAMLYAMGTLRANQKKFVAESPGYFEAALQLFEAGENVHGQALVLSDWAYVDRMRGDYAAMLAKYREALAKMRSVGDPLGEATILSGLATYHLDERDTITAETMLADALALSQDVGYLRGEIQVVTRFAELYLRTGRISEARKAYHRVLRTVREIGDRGEEAQALYGLATVRCKEGQLESAEMTAASALAVADEVGDRLVAGKARHLLGEIGVTRGEDSAAEGHLIAATELFRDLDGHLLWAKSLALLAEVRDSMGDVDRAAEDAAQASALLSVIDSREAIDLRAALADYQAPARIASVGAGTGRRNRADGRSEPRDWLRRPGRNLLPGEEESA